MEKALRLRERVAEAGNVKVMHALMGPTCTD
jgi:hypothetical protein